MARHAAQGETRLFRSRARWAAIAVCSILGLLLFGFIDLTPQIESDFFFSTDDPELQSSLRIEKEFGQGQQIFIAVRSGNIVSKTYLLRLLRLTADVREIRGVAQARSLADGPEKPDEVLERDAHDVFEDVAERPFWRRLLLAPDGNATFVVLLLRGQDHSATIRALDRVIAKHSRPDFQLAVSGVPYVSEHIRRKLTSDLRVFSLAAFGAFSVLVAVLFRSFAVMLGTMIAATSASFGTFLLRALFGMKTDVLPPISTLRRSRPRACIYSDWIFRTVLHHAALVDRGLGAHRSVGAGAANGRSGSPVVLVSVLLGPEVRRSRKSEIRPHWPYLRQ
jgi:predicted RND superfamily exporter protein